MARMDYSSQKMDLPTDLKTKCGLKSKLTDIYGGFMQKHLNPARRRTEPGLKNPSR